MVRALAQKGMLVGLNDINLALAESAVQELRAEGLKVWALPGGVSQNRGVSHDRSSRGRVGPRMAAGEQRWHYECRAHSRLERRGMGQGIRGGCQGRFPVFASRYQKDDLAPRGTYRQYCLHR